MTQIWPFASKDGLFIVKSVEDLAHFQLGAEMRYEIPPVNTPYWCNLRNNTPSTKQGGIPLEQIGPTPVEMPVASQVGDMYSIHDVYTVCMMRTELNGLSPFHPSPQLPLTAIACLYAYLTQPCVAITSPFGGILAAISCTHMCLNSELVVRHLNMSFSPMVCYDCSEGDCCGWKHVLKLPNGYVIAGCCFLRLLSCFENTRHLVHFEKGLWVNYYVSY